MKLTNYEKKFIINFNAGEPDASLYTRDPVVTRKLDKLDAAYPVVYHREEQDNFPRAYSVPKSCITYRRPRHLIDKQRAEMWEQMNKINKHDQ